MMFKQFNALYAGLNEEISDIRKMNTESNTESNSDRNSFLYKDGSVVLPIESSTWDTIGGEHVNRNSRITYQRLFGAEYSDSYVDDEGILKVHKGSKKILASLAAMIVEPDNVGKFYGMTISYQNKKLNPLHPVIAGMITAGEIILEETFVIVLYPYKYKAEVDYERMEEYSKDIVNGITAIRGEQHRPSISYQVTNSELEDIQSFTNNSSHSIEFREDGRNVNYAMIPVQLATEGVTYPYYGLIFSDRSGGGEYKSKNIYPCLSGNIDTATRYDSRTCLGELSSSVFGSLYVLSNMNVNSLYFSDLFTSETLTFVASCQKVSSAFLGAWAKANTKTIGE